MNQNNKQKVLTSFLNEIESRDSLGAFFNRLENNPNFQDLLLLHSDELFITENEFKLLFLIWNSSEITENCSQNSVLDVFRDIALARQEKAQILNFLPLIQRGSLSTELLDIIFYSVFQIARSNDGIRSLVSGEFSFNQMKKVLGNNYEHLKKQLDSHKQDDQDPTFQLLSKKVAQSGERWYKQIRTNPIEFIEWLSNISPNPLRARVKHTLHQS